MTTTDRGRPSARAASPWAPLRHRVFLALFVAQLASNIGTLMQNVGSAWLMGDLGASASLVALVQTAIFLPVLLVGIPAGALADIVDRRRLLIVTQAWMMVSALTLAVLAFLDVINPALLLGLTFALGVGTALNGPAWLAIQPDLVPREDFGQAVALGSLTYNVGRAVGPAIGGLVVAAAGPAWVFLLNAASFVGILAVLTRWRPPVRETRLPAESLAAATRGALRYGVNAPRLRGILIRTAAFVVPAAALQALLPTVVRERLDMGSGRYGILLGCFGLGAISTVVLRPRLEARFSYDALHAGATVATAATLVVQGLVPVFWVLALALFFGGCAWTTANTTTNISAQNSLPSWVRARGLGVYLVAITGGVSIGSAVWGAVADWSLVGAHLVAAGVSVAGLAAVRRWPLARAVPLDLSVVPGNEPEVVLRPQDTDGPVLVTVVYVVPEDDVDAFLDAMRPVQGHRRRTGAYRWELFRDLAAPEQFVEAFHVQSWAEHLRQHQRLTASADANMAVVRQFMRAPASVTHFISAYGTGDSGPPPIGHPE